MAYESYYTNKIIKTTKAQYDALKNGESVKGYKLNEKDTFVLDIDSLYNDLNNYVAKRNQLENNVDLNTVTTTGFYRLNNTHANSPSAPFGQMLVCQAYGDTIAQVVFRYNEPKMFLRTGNVVNNGAGSWTEWKTISTDDHTHTSLNTAFVFKNEDMPQGSANLSATTNAHKLTLYRNGLSVPYQMDNANDGGILRCRGNSESNTIFELATWDDSGAGETIQFNYYPTTSQVTPTYSVTVPKKTGTMALTSDLDNYVKLTGNQTISGTKTFTDKISNTYLTGGILDTHPEGGGTIISYYTNDWAYLLKRGYSCAAKNVTQNTTIEPDECWFDTSPSYSYLSLTSTSDVVEIIIKGPSMLWTTKGGIGFGTKAWRAKNVKIEVGYTATNTGTASKPDSDIVWVTRINVTNQDNNIVFGNINGPTEAEGGSSTSAFTYMRLTLTNWNNKTPRIAQIFTFTVGSMGMHNAFLGKSGGNFYGSIWPTPSNTYDLGNNSNRWASVHATTFYESGTSLVAKYLGINATAKKSNYLISPSGVLTNADISDQENTDKAKLRIDLATSSLTTNKPDYQGFIYTNIWDIKNSKNNNSQLYIPNGYHITAGRRLSVRGCRDDTWQTTWKELAYYSDIPTTLKNPNALKFGSKNYDGSSAQEITLADLGGQAAGNYVTTDTPQTITSVKSFSSVVSFSSGDNNIHLTSEGFIPQNTSGTYSLGSKAYPWTNIYATQFHVAGKATMQYNSTEDCIEFIFA